MAPKMERFEMRIDDESLARIDAWSREQADRPVRAEAVRRLIDLGLSAGSERSVRFSDGEKMLILMMSDLFKRLNLRGGDTDPEFLAKVIFNGHYWAPKWEMQGVFHDHVDDPEEVRYVADVLDMWTLIERAYESFTEEEKKALLDETGVRAESVRFPGFDGNNETSQLGIARFLIEEMGRFQTFKGRGLNSHHPREERYRRMLERFGPMRRSMAGSGLSARQVNELLSRVD
jgi:uncharacterized protein YfbU (UPF0304 family)